MVFDGSSVAALLDAVTAKPATSGATRPSRSTAGASTVKVTNSTANADLARTVTGSSCSPRCRTATARCAARSQELEGITAQGLAPDPLARKAIGHNVLDPDAPAASARAGRTQGLSNAGPVAVVWG